jgi:hypothetical protein
LAEGVVAPRGEVIVAGEDVEVRVVHIVTSHAIKPSLFRMRGSLSMCAIDHGLSDGLKCTVQLDMAR